MDFNLKQWRDRESEEDDQETPALPSLKLPKLLFNSHPQHQPSALPLFVPELTSNLSAYSSDHSATPSATKFPRMESYFSLGQLQELQLQALIFRHIIAGAAIPPDLLHLVKKNIINSPSPTLSPYYPSHPLHQYYPHYQPSLVQSSGYWGRGAMDPEPGRCRRTDGKKWRCARDVVAGQKYCERHMHRGRNRSRKPVENPTPPATTPYGGEHRKNMITTTQGMVGADGGGVPHFTLSGPSPSMDLLHLTQRPSNPIIETKDSFETQNGGQTDGVRTLRHFIDDWPRSLQETDNTTNLSISIPGDPSSDFSLKLSTGNGNESGDQVNGGERERPQLNWGATWENSTMVPMGGPLAEALRSSTSSSPTSVLHRLSRGSEASYLST